MGPVGSRIAMGWFCVDWRSFPEGFYMGMTESLCYTKLTLQRYSIKHVLWSPEVAWRLYMGASREWILYKLKGFQLFWGGRGVISL